MTVNQLKALKQGDWIRLVAGNVPSGAFMYIGPHNIRFPGFNPKSRKMEPTLNGYFAHQIKHYEET